MTTAAAPPLLEASGVEVTLGSAPILRGADVAVEPGRLIAVVGPNGAGKSTLVRACAGLQRTSGGAIRWGGEDVRALRGRRLARLRAFVPQRGRAPGGVRVREAVALGRAPHIPPLGRPTQRDRDAVDRAMARAGVLELAERTLPTLSGGELQRVHIAVALAQESPVLIADEPTSQLDLGATVAVAKLLRELADGGLAVVLVVHDLALATAVADTAFVMSHGRTVASGPPADVLDRERLAEVWDVEADLVAGDGGRTALHVAWLGGAA